VPSTGLKGLREMRRIKGSSELTAEQDLELRSAGVQQIFDSLVKDEALKRSTRNIEAP
jgi:hypothetical protein